MEARLIEQLVDMGCLCTDINKIARCRQYELCMFRPQIGVTHILIVSSQYDTCKNMLVISPKLIGHLGMEVRIRASNRNYSHNLTSSERQLSRLELGGILDSHHYICSHCMPARDSMDNKGHNMHCMILVVPAYLMHSGRPRCSDLLLLYEMVKQLAKCSPSRTGIYWNAPLRVDVGIATCLEYVASFRSESTLTRFVMVCTNYVLSLTMIPASSRLSASSGRSSSCTMNTTQRAIKTWSSHVMCWEAPESLREHARSKYV